MKSIDSLLNNVYWNDAYLNKVELLTLFTTIHHGYESAVFGDCRQEYQIAYSIIQRERKQKEYTLSNFRFEPFDYIEKANLEIIEKVLVCMWIDAFLYYVNRSGIAYNDAAQNKYWNTLKRLKKSNVADFKDNLIELKLDEPFHFQFKSYLKDRCLNTLIKHIVYLHDNKTYLIEP